MSRDIDHLADPVPGLEVVDTFAQYLQRKREALKVLRGMFYREESGSPEHDALLEAIATLTMLLDDAARA